MIPQTFINELIARADLLEVIGTRVALKKAGSNHKGLCPFHDEKTPSFTVSPEKGFYKCFGCGAYGNAIDFIMQYENRSFPEAIEILADGLRLEIPVDRDDTNRDEFEILFSLLAEADQLYRNALRGNEAAIAYLKQRGIDGPTAARFALGYAPDAWDTVLTTLGKSDAQRERLLQVGLCVRNDNDRSYDRFRDRIMFPIRDPRGRVRGFGGRLLGAGEPKYLNSPDTPLFDKSRTLYGLYEARQTPGRPDTVIVVEGYIDVIALAQAGIGPAIATMGTATTADNVRQITRLSDRVVFCFDGDRAGRAAAWRALESVLPYGGGSVAIEFLLLPDGEDPDSYVRAHGAEQFKALLQQAIPLSRFMVSHASVEFDLASAEGAARFIGKLRPLLTRLPRGVYRDLILAELAEVTGIAQTRLESNLDDSPKPASRLQPARTDRNRTVMRKLITLIVHYPQAAAALGAVEGLNEIDAPGADLLRKLLEMAAANPQVRSAELVEAFREDSQGRYLKQLAVEDPIDQAEQAGAVLKEGLEKLVAGKRRADRGNAVRRRGEPLDPAERPPDT